MDACNIHVRGYFFGSEIFLNLCERRKVPLNASHVRVQPRDKAAEHAKLEWPNRHDHRGRKCVLRMAMKAES